MMQTSTSFAIFLPQMACFLHLGLSELPWGVNVGANEASVKIINDGHKLE